MISFIYLGRPHIQMGQTTGRRYIIYWEDSIYSWEEPKRHTQPGLGMYETYSIFYKRRRFEVNFVGEEGIKSLSISSKSSILSSPHPSYLYSSVNAMPSIASISSSSPISSYPKCSSLSLSSSLWSSSFSRKDGCTCS